jgi:hypothetical protein
VFSFRYVATCRVTDAVRRNGEACGHSEELLASLVRRNGACRIPLLSISDCDFGEWSLESNLVGHPVDRLGALNKPKASE